MADRVYAQPNEIGFELFVRSGGKPVCVGWLAIEDEKYHGYYPDHDEYLTTEVTFREVSYSGILDERAMRENGVYLADEANTDDLGFWYGELLESCLEGVVEETKEVNVQITGDASLITNLIGRQVRVTLVQKSIHKVSMQAKIVALTKDFDALVEVTEGDFEGKMFRTKLCCPDTVELDKIV